MLRFALAALTLFILQSLHAEEVGEVCDRNGVVLVRYVYDRSEPLRLEYPFQALAAHVLQRLKADAVPRGGQKVYLTLDARIQWIAEHAMRRVGRGAVVIVDPASGEILAMASAPSYDPGDDEHRPPQDDPLATLLNRAISGFAPGATFLPVTALAAASAGLSEARFDCTGGAQYGSKFMKCHIFGRGEHGSLDVAEALTLSCGAFFYQYGNAAGIDAIHRIGKLLGLGHATGVPLQHESSGILPNPEWLRRNYPREKWTAGYTANTSIGQGFVLATPLQMAMVGATLANGGLSFRPRLIFRKTGSEGNLGKDVQAALRANLLQHGLTVESIKAIRHGQRERVKKVAKPETPGTGMDLTGSTGAAQAWSSDGKPDNHAWFVGFAPYEKPRLAICVLVQGAKSSQVAFSLAARIMEQALAEKLPAPVPVKSNPGHGKPVYDLEAP